MKRIARVLSVLVLLAGIGWLGWQRFGPPDPLEILARIEVPPAPVLSPEDERETFRVAPGFRVELVAAEPLVVDPVAMDWDDDGRLYVVEMRGFMPDVDGRGEDEPSGRVVVLTDRDGDGRMDESQVFLDGLVLPRAIAVLPEGVLIGVPPDLLLCRDADEDLRCAPEERSRILDYAVEAGNVEHRENGLLPALDGWIYNAKSARRFKMTEDPEAPIVVDETVFRGQWGLAQDDAGRLYYNHNSGFLYADLIPAHYPLRQAGTAARLVKPGVNVDLWQGASVFGVRVAPGLNRATQPGSLRRDGRQDAPTAVSGVAIQRGLQYGPDRVGDAFVPESAGAAVAHFSLREDDDGLGLHSTHRLYPDDDWGEREFLASSDERFRPVDAKLGPDGAIWVIDMYRGIIQHTVYVSDYLRRYIAEHDLASPGATGRLWRIVRSDRPIDYTPPPLETPADWIDALDHPNGWVRDRAQRRLIHARQRSGDREGSGNDGAAEPSRAEPRIRDALRRLEAFSEKGQSHALWTLHARGELDPSTWRAALDGPYPSIRALALRLGESLAANHRPELRARALAALDTKDARLRLQALHTLGALDPATRPLETLLDHGRRGGPLDRQAVLSSLAGLETEALASAIAAATDASNTPEASEEQAQSEFLEALSSAVFMQALAEPDRAAATRRLLDRIDALRSDHEPVARRMLAGIRLAQELPGASRVVLGEPHPLFEADPSAQGSDFANAVLSIRRGFTWEGDPSPGGARALEPEEERLRRAGAELYAATCATCHGLDGRGAPALAPPLVGSAWVRNADEWLVRIALQGVRGPIEVQGETWRLAMPGHGHDPRFDDRGLAGVATFLRRAWGHGDDPISPDTVARIRAETRHHPEAWTADELLALPITHRLDRYTGRYRIPIVGIELVVGRLANQLSIGRGEGDQAPMTELGNGLFVGDSMQIRFDPSRAGPAESARLQVGSDSIEIDRLED